MNLREQIQPAWIKFKGTAHFGNWEEAMFAEGYKAALALIANPDDEMVERCARALDHPSVYMGGASEQSKRNARAVLKAAAGV